MVVNDFTTLKSHISNTSLRQVWNNLSFFHGILSISQPDSRSTIVNMLFNAFVRSSYHWNTESMVWAADYSPHNPLPLHATLHSLSATLPSLPSSTSRKMQATVLQILSASSIEKQSLPNACFRQHHFLENLLDRIIGLLLFHMFTYGIGNSWCGFQWGGWELGCCTRVYRQASPFFWGLATET